MSVLSNDPAEFADEALRGFVDAYSDVVTLVPGGVVRATATPPGKVAVVVGGGSGHYPAFCGLVGPGFADGAVVGNIFTSPSADDAASVSRSAASDAGVLMLTGNYAGDVMNFGLAQRRLEGEGIDARFLVVTDDIASAPAGQEDKRRGIAGDLTVFKVAAAAAEAGYDLDGVERAAAHANARTRTLGVAFDGCTLPGADEPLFTVPDGSMGLGVGIHGEPGIGESPMPTAADLAATLVERVLAEAPEPGPARAAVVLNGLGRTKYEELFVVWSTVAPLLRDAGVTIVAPDVGELVTSLDMAGCSLTLMWLDDELEQLWTAPAAAPAYRKGRVADVAGQGGAARGPAEAAAAAAPPAAAITPASERGREHAAALLAAMDRAVRALADAETALGRLDSVAGDGDHGRGMVRGSSAALAAAREVVEAGGAPGDALTRAGQAWSSRAGGTSGVLWGAMLEAAGAVVPDDDATWQRWDADAAGLVTEAVGAAIDAMRTLGKAEPGDKTMLDALAPFHEALRSGSGDVGTVWADAAARATQAAEDTAALRPRLGRARPLAEQSVGHPDPGAVSLALIATAVGSSDGSVPTIPTEDA
ncbi:dihydroxyacetone kinase family protein [Cellulomonas sp. ATA003]|uniref:dihydroxyacetone kinase family protein n=1 Tax=Cellulomonas sp. ATA003 TaxID=3073064 RepID=UPI0028731938|nr:dihydroxyacetone kinase family protein [Cellulomonas sp. ATA003]WNB86607.1 dihydroxyacetone kinase family protein [Cellulomonas sp. ATA003]